MPHLSIETYVTQYFWLVVILFTFYYISVTQIIPKISETFKTRKKLESLAIESSTDTDSPALKRSIHIISNSISGSKHQIQPVDTSNKYHKHFVESNKAWIQKTLSNSN